MAYVPFSPEIGAKYTLTGPDGSIATFNDSTDPNYVGVLSEVTGLDSATVRESADDLVQTDGGWHGDFWYGRRPITLAGTVYGHADAASRAVKLDRLRRASNAMRGDAILSWQNTAAGSVKMRTWVRRQQPLRISGNWNKDFQLLLVSQFAPLFSDTLHTFSNLNTISNPSFETNTTGWGTGSSFRIATGATLARVTTTAQAGTASLQVSTTAVVNQGADYTTLAVTAGQTYSISAYVKGNAGGERVQMMVGDGTVGFATTNVVTLTTSFQRIQFNWTPTTSGTTGLAVRHVDATAVVYFVDAVQALTGQNNFPVFFDTTGFIAPENQGDFPSYPALQLWGPATNPIYTNTTTGAPLKFLSGYTVASGHYASVDTLNHLNLLDDITNQTGSIDFVNTTWPYIQSGFNNMTMSGGGSFVISWRDCWI